MKKILYKLNWSGGDHWYFRMGLTTPDGLSHMFEDGTLFRAGHPTSYAADTPEEACRAAEARIRATIADEEARLKIAERDLAESRRLVGILEKQRDDLALEAAKLAQCRSLVGAFFKEDLDKTRLWFKAKNPLLGDISPDDMIAMHRTEKLLSFILGQLAENQPPQSLQT
jgi:hypothetical protein